MAVPGLVAMHGISLVVASGGYSPFVVYRLSLQWLLWLWSTGSRAGGLQELQLKGSRVQAQ